MKLSEHWRYRVHSYWCSFGHFCNWPAMPYRVIRTQLWNWCHYRHGSGSHLNVRKHSWREVWRNEVGKHRFGEY